MNKDLREFIARYLSIVLGTLMLVSFYTFVSIPYTLGGHPGDARLTQQELQAPVPLTATEKPVTPVDQPNA